MAWTLIRHVAQELSPNRPIMFLAELVRRPRPTAKSWYSGHRRPPIGVLEMLRDEVLARGLIGLGQQLAYYVRQREYEPKHRTGFWLIDPVTGMNRSNRHGRPPKQTGV